MQSLDTSSPVSPTLGCNDSLLYDRVYTMVLLRATQGYTQVNWALVAVYHMGGDGLVCEKRLCWVPQLFALPAQIHKGMQVAFGVVFVSFQRSLSNYLREENTL